MRFVLYNIRYATGTGPAFHLPVPGAGYLRSNSRVLDRITQYLKSLNPDLVGLIEIDTGSIRSGLVNQAKQIADSLGYAETASFTHAFKRWTGRPPSRYRQVAGGPP